MKKLNEVDFKLISGGICTTYHYDKKTGNITKSGCLDNITITASDPYYQEYLDAYTCGKKIDAETAIYC